MKILNVFRCNAGSRLRLRTRASANVMAYVAFLRHIPSGDIVAEWTSDILEEDGGRAILDEPSGYGLTVAPLITGTQPGRFEIDLKLDDIAIHTTAVSCAPKNTFGWTFTI